MPPTSEGRIKIMDALASSLFLLILEKLISGEAGRLEAIPTFRTASWYSIWTLAVVLPRYQVPWLLGLHDDIRHEEVRDAVRVQLDILPILLHSRVRVSEDGRWKEDQRLARGAEPALYDACLYCCSKECETHGAHGMSEDEALVIKPKSASPLSASHLSGAVRIRPTPGRTRRRPRNLRPRSDVEGSRAANVGRPSAGS